MLVMYTMDGCGFCSKAKQMFANELKSGEMMLKSPAEAPPGVSGFPTFAYNGKMHSGLPSSKEELYAKLGYQMENYQGSPPPLGGCVCYEPGDPSQCDSTQTCKRNQDCDKYPGGNNMYCGTYNQQKGNCEDTVQCDSSQEDAIMFYHMKGCPHCTAAEQTLASELQSGMVVMKDASEAPPGMFQGYPAFYNPSTNMKTLGAPKSYDDLLMKLSKKENYMPPASNMYKMMHSLAGVM